VSFRLVSVIAAVVLSCASLAPAKDLAVVSHKSNSLSTITIADLLKVCKGQTTHWPDGKPITCVIRNPTSPDMKVALEKIYIMSKDELIAAVAAANRGRMNHPAVLVLDSDDAVVKRVETTPGSVGLVDVYAITGGVNVVKVGGKLPLEPGYPLHGN